MCGMAEKIKNKSKIKITKLNIQTKSLPKWDCVMNQGLWLIHFCTPEVQIKKIDTIYDPH